MSDEPEPLAIEPGDVHAYGVSSTKYRLGVLAPTTGGPPMLAICGPATRGTWQSIATFVDLPRASVAVRFLDTMAAEVQRAVTFYKKQDTHPNDDTHDNTT